jgi:solute carrier family 35 protein E1
VGLVLFYAFNIGYNVYNKETCKVLDFPLTIAVCSLGAGIVYFVPLWVFQVRPFPALTANDYKKITVISMLHSVGHMATVIAMSAGAVSFTHIVKALEPIFVVLFSFLMDGKMDKFSINFWLLPIIAGVMWAAVGSKIAAGTDIFADINPTAVAGAMTSNICFALRGTLSKKVTSAIPKEKNLTSTNLYALMTFICFFLCMPFAAVIEGERLKKAWPPVSGVSAIPEKIMGVKVLSTDKLQFLIEINMITGLLYYLYNEMQYLVLGEISATATAVANTVKRVVILLATVAFLGETMDQHKAIGATVAIGATMIYSIAKSKK